MALRVKEDFEPFKNKQPQPNPKTAKKTYKLNFAVQNKTRNAIELSSRNSDMTDEGSLFPKEECFDNKYGKQINSCLGM